MNNAERKKRKPSNLVVSIPRNLLHIDVCPEHNLSLCSEELITILSYPGLFT